MTAQSQVSTRDKVTAGLFVWAFLGFWPILIAGIAIWFLWWLLRTILVVWIGLALAMRWAWYAVVKSP